MGAIRLTGKMVNFNRLTVASDEMAVLQQALQDLGEQGPFNVILDSTLPQPLAPLLGLLDQHGIAVMAVVDGLLADEARQRGLVVLPADRPMQRVQPVSEVHVAASAPVQDGALPAATAPQTVVHQGMLRTGQQLLAEQSDVVLVGDMNSGSELIAGGSVHVYGNAGGRIVAGCNGRGDARIFCQKLNAELISIGGTYCVAESMPAHLLRQAAVISLSQDDELVFEPLKAVD